MNNRCGTVLWNGISAWSNVPIKGEVHLTYGTSIHILNTIPELCDGIINFRIRLGAVSKIIRECGTRRWSKFLVVAMLFKPNVGWAKYWHGDGDQTYRQGWREMLAKKVSSNWQWNAIQTTNRVESQALENRAKI